MELHPTQDTQIIKLCTLRGAAACRKMQALFLSKLTELQTQKSFQKVAVNDNFSRICSCVSETSHLHIRTCAHINGWKNKVTVRSSSKIYLSASLWTYLLPTAQLVTTLNPRLLTFLSRVEHSTISKADFWVITTSWQHKQQERHSKQLCQKSLCCIS